MKYLISCKVKVDPSTKQYPYYISELKRGSYHYTREPTFKNYTMFCSLLEALDWINRKKDFFIHKQLGHIKFTDFKIVVHE